MSRDQYARNQRGSHLRIGSNIAQRFILFAAGVLRVAKTLPKDFGSAHIAKQLVRSATSCGANYEEGRAAESNADFIHKLALGAKEARESVFWLELVAAASLTPIDVQPLIVEAGELAAILAASVNTARQREKDF